MFDEKYPTLAAWILDGDRWITFGRDEMSNSYVCILELGGMVWESGKHYKTVEEMFVDAEAALKELFPEL